MGYYKDYNQSYEGPQRTPLMPMMNSNAYYGAGETPPGGADTKKTDNPVETKSNAPTVPAVSSTKKLENMLDIRMAVWINLIITVMIIILLIFMVVKHKPLEGFYF